MQHWRKDLFYDEIVKLSRNVAQPCSFWWTKLYWTFETTFRYNSGEASIELYLHPPACPVHTVFVKGVRNLCLVFTAEISDAIPLLLQDSNFCINYQLASPHAIMLCKTVDDCFSSVPTSGRVCIILHQLGCKCTILNRL